MGTKYIIEVEDKPFELLSEDGFTSEKLFRVKGFNSLVFDWNGLNKLTPYTEPDLSLLAKENFERGYRQRKAEDEKEIEQVRKEAYEQGQEDLRKSCVPKDEEAYGIGYNEGFRCGLDLAWDAAKKIVCYEIDGGYPIPQMFDLFNRDHLPKILSDYTASEAIEKLKAYEQEQEEIKVGDVVRVKNAPEVEIWVTDISDEEGGLLSGLALKTVASMCSIGDTYINRNIYNFERTGEHYDKPTVLEKMRGENND